MLVEEYYEQGSDFKPDTFFFCGKCHVEMVEVEKADAFCPRCDKIGWYILYRCPLCNAGKKIFKQDMNSRPLCYSCF